MKKKTNDLCIVIEKKVYRVIKNIFRMFYKEVNDKDIRSIIQFIKFGFVGVSNTIIAYLLNMCFLYLFHSFGMSPKIDYLMANYVAFVLSVTWSYYWNNQFVFVKDEGERRIWWKSLLKTYISYSFTGIFLTTVLSLLWINVLNISKMISPIINYAISVPINFLINKYWAFKSET